MEGLGADRDRLRAAVGPCIGPASYEVGLEFLERFVARRPRLRRGSSRPAPAPDKRMFDLPAFVLGRLARRRRRAPANGSAATPAPSRTLFFSNRRAFKRGEPDYGRLLSAIVLD